jgi:heat shock protein HtpX
MLETIVMQLSKPYFLYPIVILTLLAGFTCITLKIMRVNNARTKSIFYALPFVIPLIVYLFYPPTIEAVKMRAPLFWEVSRSAVLPQTPELTFSIVSILCVIGLVFGLFLFTFTHLLGVNLVCKLRGVTELYPEDEPAIYSMIEKLARKAGITRPRIGVTDGLDANAFTIGSGKNAMIVLSQGLISLLSRLELESVAAHEISHIKNGDFNFMALSSSLKVVSFYNPVCYLLSAAVSREREILADETGAKIASRPSALKSALLKIAKAPKPQTPLFARLISGFFIVSEVGFIKSAFASHPTLDARLIRIDRCEKHGRWDKVKGFFAAVMIFSAITLTGVMLYTSSAMNSMRFPGNFLGRPYGFNAFTDRYARIYFEDPIPITSWNIGDGQQIVNHVPLDTSSSSTTSKEVDVASGRAPFDPETRKVTEYSPLNMILGSLTNLVTPFLNLVQGKAFVPRAGMFSPLLPPSTNALRLNTVSQPQATLNSFDVFKNSDRASPLHAWFIQTAITLNQVQEERVNEVNRLQSVC